MKTKAFLLAPFAITLLGCSHNEITDLTFGMELSQSDLSDYFEHKNFLKELDYSSLLEKMSENGYFNDETFLLVLYSKNTTCSCWASVREFLRDFVKTSGYCIYSIQKEELISNSNDLGFKDLNKVNEVNFAIIQKGKITKQYQYDYESNFLQDYQVTMNEISKYVSAPKGFKYLSLSKLDEKIVSSESFAVQYIWTSCGDCKFTFKNILYPYISNNDLSKNYYFVDLEEISGGSYSPQNTRYVTAMKKYGISEEGNSTYGFGRGFVPMSQHLTNGVIDDAGVWFNDPSELVGDSYKFTSTYFSLERCNNLKYLNTIPESILDGLQGKVTYTSLTYTDKLEFYKPLLNSFLDKYVK